METSSTSNFETTGIPDCPPCQGAESNSFEAKEKPPLVSQASIIAAKYAAIDLPPLASSVPSSVTSSYSDDSLILSKDGFESFNAEQVVQRILQHPDIVPEAVDIEASLDERIESSESIIDIPMIFAEATAISAPKRPSQDDYEAKCNPVEKPLNPSKFLPPISPSTSMKDVNRMNNTRFPDPSSPKKKKKTAPKITYLGRVPSYPSSMDEASTSAVSSRISFSEIQVTKHSALAPNHLPSPISKSSVPPSPKSQQIQDEKPPISSNIVSVAKPALISVVIAYIALLLCRVLGAGVAVISKALTGKVHMVSMLFFRELFGFVAHLPLYLLRPREKGKEVTDPESGEKFIQGEEKRVRLPPRSTLALLVLLSISSVTSMLAFLVTSSEASITMSGIANATSPVITAAVAIVLGHEKGSCMVFISVLVGVCGSVVSLGETLFIPSSSSSTSTLGLIAILSYVICSVVYFLFSPMIYSKAKIHPFEVMFWVYGSGVIMSGILVLVFCRDIFIEQCASFTWQVWLLLVGMGALGTTGLWGAQAYASDVLRSPTIVHAFSMLAVIINMGSAAILLGEMPSSWEIIGGVLVMIGVVFLIVGKAQIKKREETANKESENDEDSVSSEIIEKTQQSTVMIGCFPIVPSQSELSKALGEA
ncbi:hypothetical protein ADUPG1_013572 [Aduncisulcus paluster]|uniref:EamA domain-containing protein n=1 Tax=Aduncisulcus paluster TaxID=2918883 RepID=A0ABQ5K707_9EUKA|nr:hypothetical protein ADUPG1_013572 [Aduncisulcus paluster]|eukprot:gnl/Carplike_NY0171/3593_a4854_376.p1 GENE.gnl/Carplike_NY0171/3593_a4854_376~~gnl/Carplike_NY0171/3593_a4854_376.p1  ORF type:complete len:651 (+),score=217.56 gnl/Carplike_NY0171/3593_a4854_376:52-2004(+)